MKWGKIDEKLSVWFTRKDFAIDRNERAWIYSYNVKCSFSDYIWLVHKAFSFKAFNLTRFVANNNNNKASLWQQRRKWLNVLRWRYETFYANEKKYASKKLQEIERIFFITMWLNHISRERAFSCTHIYVCACKAVTWVARIHYYQSIACGTKYCVFIYSPYEIYTMR